MRTMNRNKIGLAGELRVMSELLLRGHNPAKSYLEDGADLILENNLRVEVKSAHRVKTGGARFYYFTLRSSSGHKKQQELADCNFIVFWCIDDDVFYIIPRAYIEKNVCFTDVSANAKHKYACYLNKWELLGVSNGSK